MLRTLLASAALLALAAGAAAQTAPGNAPAGYGGASSPPSTLTLPAPTTAYSAGNLIANSATAGNVVNPSFAIPPTGGAIALAELTTNDTTATAWGAQSINIDLWSAAPTWTNGDRGAWSPATGTSVHLGTFTCTMSAEYGDGAFAECAPAVGSFVPIPAGVTTVYWSLQAVTGSGVTGSGKTFTLTARYL